MFKKKKPIKLSDHSQSWTVPRKNIQVVRVIQDKFPYFHFDIHAVWNKKNGSQSKLIFGVPYNKRKGLSFYTFSNEGKFRHKEIPEKHKKKLEEIEYPECDFHKKTMKPTKWFGYKGKRNFQFKCPECFLCKRVNIDKNAGTKPIRIGVKNG